MFGLRGIGAVLTATTAAATMCLAGCSSSPDDDGNATTGARPSTSSSALSSTTATSGSGSTTAAPGPTTPAASGPQLLQTDQQLDPSLRYRTPSGFEPAFTFRAPNADWYPFLRGGSAMNLRETTRPTSGDVPTTIEMVGDTTSLDDIVRALLSNDALAAGPQHTTTVGGRPARWFDLIVRRSATLHAPLSLDDERVGTSDSIRVYAVAGPRDESAALFLIISTPGKDPAFVRRAEALIRSVRMR